MTLSRPRQSVAMGVSDERPDNGHSRSSGAPRAYLGAERSDVTEAVQPVEGPTTFFRARRPTRVRHRSARGATMAEFALIAPVGFLLLLSIIVVGIVVTNLIQVTNVARAGARMAAICAGYPASSLSSTPQTDILPSSSSTTLHCNVPDLETYMASQLTAVPANSVNPSVQLCIGAVCTTPTDLPNTCQPNELIEVEMRYPQPLYLPMVSQFFESTPNTGIRQLTAHAEAECE